MLKVRLSSLLLASALLAGCPANVKQPAPSAPAPASSPVPAPAIARGSQTYTIDPDASQVRILVYRGGALARLGHNHVISASSLVGQVAVHPDPSKSTFELSFPVTELVVDDAQARREAGTDFPGEIGQGDRDGTRKNMLREEVLDAVHFPRVSLRSLTVTPPLQSAKVLTRITIRSASRDVEVPVAINIVGSRLTASGEFRIKQTDFGIKPFSIGLGALEVVDQLQVRFTIVASRK